MYERVKKNNSVLIPAKYKTKDNFNLGIWVSNIRGRYKNKKLHSSQIIQLEALSFAWDAIEAIWVNGYQKYKQYVKNTNSSYVPAKYKTKDGYSLGGWYCKQNKLNEEKKLLPERKAKLNKLGFFWGKVKFKGSPYIKRKKLEN